jgi:hypothetical protein
VGLIGAYVNIVEGRFKEPQRVRMFLPMTCRRLYLSLEEPQDFITALREATAAEATPEPAPAGTRPRRRRRAG